MTEPTMYDRLMQAMAAMDIAVLLGATPDARQKWIRARRIPPAWQMRIVEHCRGRRLRPPPSDVMSALPDGTHANGTAGDLPRGRPRKVAAR